jgi:hypothetical protein
MATSHNNTSAASGAHTELPAQRAPDFIEATLIHEVEFGSKSVKFVFHLNTDVPIVRGNSELIEHYHELVECFHNNFSMGLIKCNAQWELWDAFDRAIDQYYKKASKEEKEPEKPVLTMSFQIEPGKLNI